MKRIKLIYKKLNQSRNEEFKCASFVNDLTCFLQHKKFDVVQFLTAHISVLNAEDFRGLNKDK